MKHSLNRAPGFLRQRGKGRLMRNLKFWLALLGYAILAGLFIYGMLMGYDFG